MDAGAAELGALKLLITSNIGFIIALFATAYGAYLVLVKQQMKAGILLLLTAAMIPFLTKFMDGLRTQFCPAVTYLGGECGDINAFTQGTTGSGPGAGSSGPANYETDTPDVNTDGTDSLRELSTGNNGMVTGGV